MPQAPRVSDEEILSVLNDADEVLSAPEIADELPLGDRAVLKRLHSLSEDGRLKKKKIGQTWAWWTQKHESSLLDSQTGSRSFYNIHLPLQDDDPRREIIRECYDFIRENERVTIHELNKKYQHYNEISLRELKSALEQLPDGSVSWNEDQQRWEAGEA